MQEIKERRGVKIEGNKYGKNAGRGNTDVSETKGIKSNKRFRLEYVGNGVAVT